MSAFGTEKFPTTSLRLGMPSAYQNAYSVLGSMPRFAPEKQLPSVDISVGEDFQAQYHKQKMMDAHHMSRAKVQSTVNMYNRANSAPNNSPGHQQPVLGQRVFANQSMGALVPTSTREDYARAPFHYSDAHGSSSSSRSSSGSRKGGSNGRLVGGVLRTAQGQSYGMSLLQKRLGDFERIAQLAEQYQGLQPMSRGSMGAAPFAGELPQPFQSLATLPTIELSQLLQNVVDSINLGDTDDKGVNRLTVSDSTRAFALIVRMATTAGGEDLADVIEYLDGTSAEDGIIPKLRSLTQRPITDQAKSNQEIFISLLEFWERVKVYLTKMVATVGMPFKNRASASQAYIKTLGFTKLFKGRLPEEFIERQDAQEAVDIRRGAQFPGAAPGAPRRPDDDDEDGGLPPLPPRGRVLRREDTQHGYIGPGSARFDGDDRQRFGYASGEWRTGGRPVGWAGEEVPGYGEAPPAGTEEQQEGKEEFEDEALATVPGNAGPRLRSTMSPQTGEWDIRALPSPFTSPRRRAVADDDDAGLYNPDEAAPAPRAPGAPARAGGLPPFLQSRRDLPDTISGLQQMAARVNAHYKNTLPDGRGAITVNDYSKVRSVKTNFIRRLNIPS